MAKPAQKEERGFRYQKRDRDSVKERANMKGGNYDSYIKPKFKQWKPKEGKNLIRILPPTWDDARHYGLDIFVNFGVGPDNQSYLSLSKHDRGADPLAEARREAMNDGNKDFAKKLNPSQRLLYWIIDRMDEDEGPLLWAAPFTFDKSLANLCIDEDTKDVFYIDDPETGRDIRFYREGTGLTTTYDPSKMKVLKEAPLHEDEKLQDEWLEFINENPLPSVLNFYDYEHIKAQFGGSSRPDDEDETPARSRKPAKVDDEEDEKPAPRARAKAPVEDDDEDEKPARRATAKVEDEDEPPARSRARSRPEPEDDDEDEKPAPRRSRAAAPADDDDEDESPPSTRRTRGGESADEEEGGGSLRERLAARRRSRNSEDD